MFRPDQPDPCDVPPADPGAGTSVRIEPAGVEIQCRPGENLMRAIERARLRWPTCCNGGGICGACHVRVVSSEGPLPTPGIVERQGLAALPAKLQTSEVRLACQLVPHGRLVVERRNAPLPDKRVR